VDGVVLLGQRAAGLHELEADDAQAALLKAADDLARQAALDAIRLDDDQGAFHNKKMLLAVRSGESDFPRQKKRAGDGPLTRFPARRQLYRSGYSCSRAAR